MGWRERKFFFLLFRDSTEWIRNFIGILGIWKYFCVLEDVRKMENCFLGDVIFRRVRVRIEEVLMRGGKR